MTDNSHESFEHLAPVEGEVYGNREFGDVDQVWDLTADHLIGTAEVLMHSETTHVELEVPRKDGGQDVIVDGDNKPIQFPVGRDAEGRLHISKEVKTMLKFAGVTVLTIGGVRIVSKIIKHKK